MTSKRRKRREDLGDEFTEDGFLKDRGHGHNGGRAQGPAPGVA